MIDKVVNAIRVRDSTDEFAIARAAIKAMREPTDKMLAVGPPEPYMDKDVWAKMIDSILD